MPHSFQSQPCLTHTLTSLSLLYFRSGLVGLCLHCICSSFVESRCFWSSVTALGPNATRDGHKSMWQLCTQIPLKPFPKTCSHRAFLWTAQSSLLGQHDADAHSHTHRSDKHAHGRITWVHAHALSQVDNQLSGRRDDAQILNPTHGACTWQMGVLCVCVFVWLPQGEWTRYCMCSMWMDLGQGGGLQ